MNALRMREVITPDDTPATILVVDDDERSRRLLMIMLVQSNYELIPASSGEQALAIVAAKAPDLILLDVMMPGIDGNEVARILREAPATSNIPIIMITAFEYDTARMVGLAAGVADFLIKPVNCAELLVRIKNLLRLKAYGDYYDRYSQTLEREVVSRTSLMVERTFLLEQQSMVLTAQADLLDLARDAIIVRDMDGYISTWNRGAEKLYGYSRAHAIGKNVFDLLGTSFFEGRDAVEVELTSEGQWEGEAIHRKPDGSIAIVASRWTLQRDADGMPVQVLSIDNDITDRKHADDKRMVLAERLSLATEVAKVGVWDWEMETKLITWDSTMYAIYGFTPDVAVHYDDWANAIAPEDLERVQQAHKIAIAEKGSTVYEFRIILRDGTIRTISSAARVVLDANGAVSRMIGINADVSERKATEAALEQSGRDSMRFKNEFLSNVSHELRSPLTAIKQFSSILQSGLAGELNPVQLEYQEIVLRNVQQLQAMIDDLLEATRLESGKLSVEPELALLREAGADARHTLEGVSKTKGVSLEIDIPLDLPAAFADQTRLRQILIILLDNAIKFTPMGGHAKVSASVWKLDPRYLLVEVSDDGCGVSPDRVDRLFDRLYQVPGNTIASRKGLGLGLYICKELVTLQGGEIWVSPKVARGSTFCFTVPVFSLSSAVLPLLKNGKWPSPTTALVTITVEKREGGSCSEFREDWSRDVRILLERCLLPDLDVLLPRVRAANVCAHFFIAAFADVVGVEVLVSRIRGQFDRHGKFERTGLVITMSYTMLPNPPAEASGNPELLTAHLITALETEMENQISAGAI